MSVYSAYTIDIKSLHNDTIASVSKMILVTVIVLLTVGVISNVGAEGENYRVSFAMQLMLYI